MCNYIDLKRLNIGPGQSNGDLIPQGKTVIVGIIRLSTSTMRTILSKKGNTHDFRPTDQDTGKAESTHDRLCKATAGN